MVARPGEKLEPPCNMPDRIATIELVEDDEGALKARFGGWRDGE
jgi:hypothetical protein